MWQAIVVWSIAWGVAGVIGEIFLSGVQTEKKPEARVIQWLVPVGFAVLILALPMIAGSLAMRVATLAAQRLRGMFDRAVPVPNPKDSL